MENLLADSKREIALSNEIFRCINGSKLYGNDHEESDDDYIGIFIEPVENVFSKSMIHSAQIHERAPDEKNVDSGIDGTLYSLRHFASLALDGNPSILTILFAPQEFWVKSSDAAEKLFSISSSFVSKQAVPRFKGYLKNQLERLQGIKTGHIPNRPEIVELYGYDTKYAMSVARLALQGIEYFTDGTILSPMKDESIKLLKSIRHGGYTYEDAIELLFNLEESLYLAVDKTPLPELPDYQKVYKLVREIHEDWWLVNDS